MDGALYKSAKEGGRRSFRTVSALVPVRYRPNAASGGWGYRRDPVSLP